MKATAKTKKRNLRFEIIDTDLKFSFVIYRNQDDQVCFKIDFGDGTPSIDVSMDDDIAQAFKTALSLSHTLVKSDNGY